MTVPTLATLRDELAAYCNANGLPHESADELMFHDTLTLEQRTWLADFIDRWERAADIDFLYFYLDNNHVKLVGYSTFVAVSPDRKTLFDCPELTDGTPEQSWIEPGHLNWGEVTAPEGPGIPRRG